MEKELAEKLEKVVVCIESLGKTVSYTCECVTLLTKEIITLRDDVNKLIENNQKGASK